MKRNLPVQFWLEAVLGSLTGLAFVATLFWRDWIEATVGWDPDQHSGAVEWLLVLGLLVVTVALLSAARFEWRRAATALR
jgi:hypothetical protein